MIPLSAPSRSPSRLWSSAIRAVGVVSVLLTLPSLLEAQTAISRAGWSVVFCDSQETVGETAPASRAFDGLTTTYWTSQYFTSKPPLPHEIQIDLGSTFSVTGLRYLPRQDGKANGRIGQYEFYVSTDTTNWGTAVATGTFGNDATEKQVLFTAKSGRYVRLRALTDLSGTNYRTTVAELNVLQSGTANQAPSGTISSPSGSVTVTAGGTVSFAGSGSDPDGNTPLTYVWNFGSGSGIANSTAQNPGTVQFNTPGTYTVSLTVTDSLGLADPTPPTRTITVQAVAGTPISQAGWSVKFVDTQETVGENAPGTNAFDGNPATYWTSQYYTAKPTLPHEIQINLGASYNVTGFRYLPRQDGKPNGRIGQYEFYVSTDGTNWGTAVATGTFGNDATEKQVLFGGKTGQYIRLRALTDLSGTNYRTTVAELNVLQTGGTTNQPPDGTISSPSGNVTVGVGGTVNFAGTGTDPDGDTPLTYLWKFGSGSGIADSTVQNPGNVQFNTAGTYTVSLTVKDAKGLADPTPATRTVTVQSASYSVVSHSGWLLSFVDSQETSAVLTAGTTGVGTNAFDGNPKTMWHTDVDQTRPPPPHSIILDFGASRNICGLRMLPRQDGFERGRPGDFELYVSNDGSSWGTAVATGRFPDTENEKLVLFPTKNGRFAKLRALNEVNGQPYTAIAEINFLEMTNTADTAPTGSISAPGGNVTIPAGGVVQFAGSASDPDGNTPLTYRWTFGTGSGVPDSYAQNPGFVRFERPGTYTVTLNVADAWGLSDPTPATRTVTVLAGQAVPTAGWTVKFVDSQETASGNFRATNAFDGNASTFWETQFSSNPPAPPHELQIDLGATYTINGFTYLPRQDNVWDGRIGYYQFYVSLDGTNWGTPVTEGAFPNDGNLKEVFFVTTSARYVRLRALSEVTGKAFTNMAEFQVLAAAPVTPYVILLTPRTYDFQVSGDIYALADANLAAGQGVRFLLDGGRQTDVYSSPFEAMFTNVAQGNHVVDARVIDAGGNLVSGAATRDQARQLGIGDYYVAVGDSITYGFGDDVVSDNISSDERNATQGFTPILQNQLTAFAGHPVQVFNEGIPGEDSQSGANRINTLLQVHPEAQTFLVMYGANDAPGRASGLGLNPGSAGYSGSFKQYLQQIINAVNAAGKKVIVAKVMPIMPLNGSANQMVQQYNQVINELAANPANKLITPPDFYSYFATHTSEYIPDAYHPSGVGYQSMARIWFNCLTQ